MLTYWEVSTGQWSWGSVGTTGWRKFNYLVLPRVKVKLVLRSEREEIASLIMIEGMSHVARS